MGETRADVPIVIGHRGASGYVPEHTLESYKLAIEQGADYVEPDLVMTRDGVLVARHENEIGGTTDVGSRKEFASRRTRKVIDGREIEGWFTEDFTLAELKTLRARERIPLIRPNNTHLDGQFEVPTFEEVLELVRKANEDRTKPIGVYPETKHPTYFDRLGLSMDEPLLRLLTQYGYTRADSPVFVQSFEVGNLRRLRKRTPVPLVQLIEAEGAPYDFIAAGEKRTYADLITPAGLKEIAQYANAVGVNKNLIIPRNADGTLGPPSSLVRDAHAAGLKVHGWTFRAERVFLPAGLDMVAEVTAFLRTGMDGFFTDHPDLGVRARDSLR